MKKNRRLAKILSSGALILLTVASAVSSTFAWFATRRTVSVTADGFQVALPEEQKATLYYHNRNYSQNQNIGFDLAGLKDTEADSFSVVNPDDTEKDPTNTKYLWPKHQLTYALVFTPISTGTYSFILDSFVSEESKTKFIIENDKEEGLRLSKAIEMYAWFTEDDNTFSKAQEFFSKCDKADGISNSFDETEKKQLASFDATDTKTSIVLYFSVLFSGKASTFYDIDTSKTNTEEKAYYKQDSSTPNESNCYEGLSFEVTKFSLSHS